MLSKHFLIASLFTFATACVTHEPKKEMHRPFRVGVLKLSKELDHQKPLAPGDYAGWVEHSGVLYGSTLAKKDASNTNDLVALNFKNGAEIWRKPLLGMDLSTAVFPHSSGLILAQLDGTLSKVDFQTGHDIWKTSLPSFVNVRLVSDSGRVYAVTAGHVLYAINVNDGKIEWVYDPEMPKTEIHIHNTASPTLQGSHLYWGLSSGEIVALDTTNGLKKWRNNPKTGGGGRFHNYMGSLVVHNERLLFCRYDGLIGALSVDDKRQGELLWRVENNTGNCADADYRGGRYYAVTTSGDALSVNVETGKNTWSGVKLGLDLSTVTAAEGNVLITGTEGDIYALTLEGSLSWYDNVSGRLLSRPILLGNTAHFASGLKNIYSYQF